MTCRGVRGATTVRSNSREDILTETRRLLAVMIRLNEMDTEDVASVIFSATPDLNAEFPALAARQLGWLDVPLICTHEIGVPGALEKCIRILVQWNTEKAQSKISHVYLKEAVRLRPDLENVLPADWDELDEWIEKHREHLE